MVTTAIAVDCHWHVHRMYWSPFPTPASHPLSYSENAWCRFCCRHTLTIYLFICYLLIYLFIGEGVMILKLGNVVFSFVTLASTARMADLFRNSRLQKWWKCVGVYLLVTCFWGADYLKKWTTLFSVLRHSRLKSLIWPLSRFHIAPPT